MTALTKSIKKLTQIGRAASGVMEAAADLDNAYENYGPQGDSFDQADVAIVGVSANDTQVPVDSSGNLVAITAPAGTTTVTSNAFKTQGFGRIVGTVASNDAGTLTIRQSCDGVNFDAVTTVAITGSTVSPPVGQPFSVEVVGLYATIGFTPTGTNSLLRIFPLLRRLGSA